MKFIFSTLCFQAIFFMANAQMITGVWHGRIQRDNVEVKMIREGDSIRGTSYYYKSSKNYQRYSIKGYVDPADNSVVWWDDQLIADNTKDISLFAGKRAKADYNCPGGGVMKLDGKVYTDEEQQKTDGDVHLQKVDVPVFKDEWDFVIDNFTAGANDPDIIDSVSLVAFQPTSDLKTVITTTEPAPVTIGEKKEPVTIPAEQPKKEIVKVPVKNTAEPKTVMKATPLTIEQKYELRQKVFAKEIPLTGDSIQLSFYDNAEIDGDSISLFLNGRLIFEHIRLAEKAYVVKLAVADLRDNNELIMVAENLGSIPPNTSYMVALVGDKRYDAQLASTEGSSAMIRLTKAPQ